MLGVFSLLPRKHYLKLMYGPEGPIQDPNGQLFLVYFSASLFNIKNMDIRVKKNGVSYTSMPHRLRYLPIQCDYFLQVQGL